MNIFLKNFKFPPVKIIREAPKQGIKAANPGKNESSSKNNELRRIINVPIKKNKSLFLNFIFSFNKKTKEPNANS